MAATARIVRVPVGPGGPRRYRQVSEGPGHFELDLSSGTPDPLLLPDLRPIVARVSGQALTSSYLDHPVLPSLAEELDASWPFRAEAITVVDGALDALDRVAQVALRLGDRVVVEHPTFPPLIDLLERLHCEVVGVDLDADGPRLDQLRAAFDDPTPCRRRSCCSRAATTRRGWRCRASGPPRSPSWWAASTRSSSRTTTPTTSPRRRW